MSETWATLSQAKLTFSRKWKLREVRETCLTVAPEIKHWRQGMCRGPRLYQW